MFTCSIALLLVEAKIVVQKCTLMVGSVDSGNIFEPVVSLSATVSAVSITEIRALICLMKNVFFH